jgi:hypothetical protein
MVRCALLESEMQPPEWQAEAPPPKVLSKLVVDGDIQALLEIGSHGGLRQTEMLGPQTKGQLVIQPGLEELLFQDLASKLRSSTKAVLLGSFKTRS